MRTHLLLTGFSCTGKTSVAREAFGEQNVIDSDGEMLKWVEENKQKRFDKIYEIFIRLGRGAALALIEEAENALVDKWVEEASSRIISIGPGIPLRRDKWENLRAISYVVCFKRPAEAIYDGLAKRREAIFRCCPEAANCDNWDIGVMVGENKQPFAREVAISKIQDLLAERSQFYGDNDTEIDIDTLENAKLKLRELKASVFP